jgi:hypothetical protein
MGEEHPSPEPQPLNYASRTTRGAPPFQTSRSVPIWCNPGLALVFGGLGAICFRLSFEGAEIVAEILFSMAVFVLGLRLIRLQYWG